MSTALAFAMQLLSSLPPLIESGVDVYDLIVKANEDLKKMKKDGVNPSAQQWDELENMIEELRSQRPDLTFEE